MKVLQLFLLVMSASLLSWHKPPSTEMNNLTSNFSVEKVISNFKDGVVDNDKDGIDEVKAFLFCQTIFPI